MDTNVTPADIERSPAWIRVAFVGAVLITFLLFLTHFKLTGFGVFSDGTDYYAPLRSFVFDGDLDVTNEYEYYKTTASRVTGQSRWKFEPLQYAKGTMGMGLLLLPFFLAGHFFATVLGMLGVSVPADGFSWPYEITYCAGSIGLGVAGMVLCYRAAASRFGSWPAFVAVAGVWFASPLIFYLTIEASMSHAVSQFAVSLFLYLALTRPWMQSIRHQLLLGLVLGFAGLVRPQNAIFGVVPVVLALLEAGGATPASRLRSAGRLLVPVITVAVVSTLMILPQVAVFKAQFGSLSNTHNAQLGIGIRPGTYNPATTPKPKGSPQIQEPPQTDGPPRAHLGGSRAKPKNGAERDPWGDPWAQQRSQGWQPGSTFEWAHPEVRRLLFSGWHGLFFWHPLLFFAVVGLILNFRAMKGSPALLAAFALQVYLIASFAGWSQGAAFGGRMFCNFSLPFALGLAAFWSRFGARGKAWSLALTLLFCVWNALLALQQVSGMVSTKGSLSLGQLFENQLNVIPFFLREVLGR